MRSIFHAPLLALALLTPIAQHALGAPQGTAFTYQGELTQNGTAVSVPTDLRFSLWDAETAGQIIATPLTVTTTPEGGVFSVELDFGVGAFVSDTALWLEIEASAAGAGVFETLGRTPLRASTYSLSTRGITVDADGRVGIGNPPPAGLPTSALNVLTDNSVNDFGMIVFNDGREVPGSPATAMNVLAQDGNAIEAVADASIGSTVTISPRAIVGIATTVANLGNDPAGVIGEAISTPGFGYGVLGQGNFFGVFSVGNSGATGTKSFLIDHPLDPANLYLRHYSAEAPEPLNIYTGNATFDAAGRAAVTLPEYFHAINTDLRYTLTAVGAPMPNLHIAKKAREGQFIIAGGVPGAEVSWQVTATRDDAHVKAKGHSDVLPKRPHARGKFLAPELHGKAKSLGIFFRPERTNAAQTK